MRNTGQEERKCIPCIFTSLIFFLPFGAKFGLVSSSSCSQVSLGRSQSVFYSLPSSFTLPDLVNLTAKPSSHSGLTTCLSLPVAFVCPKLPTGKANHFSLRFFLLAYHVYSFVLIDVPTQSATVSSHSIP